MVCDRCKMAVKQILEQAELHPVAVELGVVTIEENNLSAENVCSWLRHSSPLDLSCLRISDNS